MASVIETKINRLASAKAAIKAAIEGKGVTVPDATLLDGMAALIESIQAGGGGADVSPFESIRCGTFTGTEKTITIDGVSSCKIFAMRRRTSTVTRECTALAILVKKAAGTGYAGSSSILNIMGGYGTGQLFPILSGDVLTFYATLNGDYEYVMVS